MFIGEVAPQILLTLRLRDMAIANAQQEHSWGLLGQPLRTQYKLSSEAVHRALLLTFSDGGYS